MIRRGHVYCASGLQYVRAGGTCVSSRWTRGRVGKDERASKRIEVPDTTDEGVRGLSQRCLLEG